MQCNPETQFTCSKDGKCVSLSQRCNKKIDCEDESDEDICEQVIIDERYKKEYVPEDPTGNKKLSIQLWFDVIDIVEINEPEVSKRIKM